MKDVVSKNTIQENSDSHGNLIPDSKLRYLQVEMCVLYKAILMKYDEIRVDTVFPLPVGQMTTDATDVYRAMKYTQTALMHFELHF